MRPIRTLHVHNGDAARAILERSDVEGEHAVWGETLHDGPVRGRERRALWRAERARFYQSLGPPPVAGESARPCSSAGTRASRVPATSTR